MTDTTTEESGGEGKIEFLDRHYPPLEAGDYRVIFQQELQRADSADHRIPQSTYEVSRTFAIAGERFQLKNEIIYSVFPPEGSQGEHSNTLPHVILNRSTLPWERQAIKDLEEAPWLALLLFAEEEKPEPKVITLEELTQTSSSEVEFPTVILESGQKMDDKVTVIDVDRALLDQIMPRKSELELLAHVRQSKDEKGDLTGEEQAVIICNRLPKKGGRSAVHLVSVEERYTDEGFYSRAAADKKVRLVSLKSWSFSCPKDGKSFKGLLENLDRNPSTLRLPETDYLDAERYLRMGYTLLPHSLRQGEKTVSWYHGPLATGENATEAQLPAQAADELVRYNKTTGLFDLSYAAAWEMGRLLALQSKQFSVDLYNWKRAHAQQVKQAEQQLLYPNLAVQSTSGEVVELPEQITVWFDDLSLLRGVPFNYLVPDERMLPKESIRFFYVDGLWVDCLLDGAYSIGRVTTSDYELDQSHDQSPASSPYKRVTGFIVRSEVVSGWPGLLVDGYDSDGKSLNQLRMERMSEEILLCLFEGDLFTVDIHLKPETLHFGLDTTGQEPESFKKTLRDEDGVEDETLVVDPIPWRDRSIDVLDISSLATDMQTILSLESFTSAEFALQMIEGVDRVSFKKVDEG